MSSGDLDQVRKLVAELMPCADWSDLPKDIQEWADDACINTFLTAHRTPHKAASQMHKTIQWRITTRPHETPCPTCTTNPTGHVMRLIGFDAKQRAVLYSNFAHAKDRFEPNANLIHVCYLFETCLHLGKRLGWSERWVWILDFQGFSLRDCDPRSGRLTSQVMPHYPDRIAAAVMIDAPLAFSGLWSVLSPLLDASIRQKIRFTNLNGASAAFQELELGDEVSSWIVSEMRDNRLPGRENKICWDSPGTPVQSEGSESEPQFQVEQHDSRGVASFVHSGHYTNMTNPRPLTSSQPE